METGIHLGGSDRASIRAASSFPNGLYISPLVDNSDERLHRFLLVANFANGAASFGGEADADVAELRRLATPALDHLLPIEVFEIVHYYRQRLRNYAHIETLDMAEIERARAVGDHLYCCEFEGSEFSVRDSMSKIRAMKQMSCHRYGNFVFGKNLGFPPFTFHCRCRIEGIIDGIPLEPYTKPTALRK